MEIFFIVPNNHMSFNIKFPQLYNYGIIGKNKNENIYAIYIHILADTLGSVAVLISSFLVKYYKLYSAICSGYSTFIRNI